MPTMARQCAAGRRAARHGRGRYHTPGAASQRQWPPNGYNDRMSFCEHCDGQRFDRARVLRALRQVRRELRDARRGDKCDAAIAAAMAAVRGLDVPHLEWEPDDDLVVH